jgi:hypothetical protein
MYIVLPPRRIHAAATPKGDIGLEGKGMIRGQHVDLSCYKVIQILKAQGGTPSVGMIP